MVPARTQAEKALAGCFQMGCLLPLQDLACMLDCQLAIDPLRRIEAGLDAVAFGTVDCYFRLGDTSSLGWRLLGWWQSAGQLHSSFGLMVLPVQLPMVPQAGLQGFERAACSCTPCTCNNQRSCSLPASSHA